MYSQVLYHYSFVSFPQQLGFVSRSLHTRSVGLPPRLLSPVSPRSQLSICKMGTTKSKLPSELSHEDFFRYTSGRWLWDEEQQLRDRYRIFDTVALQRVAAESVGSNRCVSMRKLAEGGYNKVFRLLMDDGKAVIARIPNPNAGPRFYTTASEVATIEFFSGAPYFCSTALKLTWSRFGQYSTSQSPSCTAGALMTITLWGQNTSSWRRLSGSSLRANGITCLLMQNLQS